MLSALQLKALFLSQYLRYSIILPSLFVRDMRGRSTTARSVDRRSLDFALPVPEGKILE